MFDFLNIPLRAQNHETKRRAFDSSVHELRQTVRETLNPQTLFKEHPQFLLGGLIAGGSIVKLLLSKRAAGLKKLSTIAAPFVLKFFLSKFSKGKS